MRVILSEWALRKLRGDDERDELIADHMPFDTKAEGAAQLVDLAGEDHGLDPVAWEKCIRQIGAKELGHRLAERNERSRLARLANRKSDSAAQE